MSYKDEILRSMNLLAEQPNVLFLGQGVRYPAHAISKQVPETAERLELPVFENTQLGMAMGMAMAGLLPVCIFPRVNFLLCACDTLVNHLDKYEIITGRQLRVIVVTQTGAQEPLDPGPQHRGNYCRALDRMLTTIPIVDLDQTGKVYDAFRAAVDFAGTTVLVQRGDLLA